MRGIAVCERRKNDWKELVRHDSKLKSRNEWLFGVSDELWKDGLNGGKLHWALIVVEAKVIGHAWK